MSLDVTVSDAMLDDDLEDDPDFEPDITIG